MFGLTWPSRSRTLLVVQSYLHTYYTQPETRCVCVARSSAAMCRRSRRSRRRRGRGCCCGGSDRQKPSFYDQPAEAIFANQNFQKKIRQIGSQMTLKKTFLKKTYFKDRYTFYNFVT